MENQKRNKPSVSFTLAQEIISMLEELAKKLDRSKSSVVEQAVKAYYEQNK